MQAAALSPSSATADAAPAVLNSQSDIGFTATTTFANPGNPKQLEFPVSRTLQDTLARYHSTRAQSRAATGISSSQPAMAAAQNAAVAGSPSDSQTQFSRGDVSGDRFQPAVDFNPDGSSSECSTAAVAEAATDESGAGNERVSDAVLRDRTSTASPSAPASPEGKLCKQNNSVKLY